MLLREFPICHVICPAISLVTICGSFLSDSSWLTGRSFSLNNSILQMIHVRSLRVKKIDRYLCARVSRPFSHEWISSFLPFSRRPCLGTKVEMKSRLMLKFYCRFYGISKRQTVHLVKWFFYSFPREIFMRKSSSSFHVLFHLRAEKVKIAQLLHRFPAAPTCSHEEGNAPAGWTKNR